MLQLFQQRIYLHIRRVARVFLKETVRYPVWT